jgi:hypothetical protein
MRTTINFEDLDLWKMAREVVNIVYSEFAKCKDSLSEIR